MDDLSHRRALGRDDAKHTSTQNDARDELAQHGRLAQPLRHLTQKLSDQQNGDEDQEHLGDVYSVVVRRQFVCRVFRFLRRGFAFGLTCGELIGKRGRW
jgi:hypothetical protein